MSNVVNSVGTKLGNVVNTVAQDVNTIVTTAIENPLPIIETIAVTAALGPEGLDLATTIGAPATAAVSSAAVAAANGANVDQIATAALSSGAGSYISGATATSVAGAQPDVNQQALANIAGSAAGSGAATAIKGGSIADILNNIASGAAAAGTAAGTQALGAGPTTANVLGGYVGGATQAGGNVLTGLEGAAAGATKPAALPVDTTNVSQVDTSQAVTPTPVPTTTTQVAETPFVDLSKPTVVASLTGGLNELPPGGFQPGQITQTAAGLFTTYVAQDGTTVNIPITVNATTGEITTTSTEPEALNAVKVLRVDPTKVNPVFYDKTPIDPGLSAEEKAALANVATKTSNDMINALKSGKALDEYYNTYAYTSSLPTFVTQMAQELANDPTGTDPSYNSLRAEYKAVTGTDFISPSGVPNVILPPVTIVASRVISSDPATGVTFVVGADGNPIPVSTTTPLTPGQTIAYNSATNTVIPSSVTSQTSADITTPDTTKTPSTTTTSGTTPGATAGATPTPSTTVSTSPSTTTLSTALNLPSAGSITTTPAGTTANTTRSYGGFVSGPTPTPTPSGTPTPTPSVTPTPTPSITVTPPPTPTPVPSEVVTPPSGPSTEKTPYPTYKPDVFVESNVPKTLAGALNIGGNLPLAGQTVGLGGGGGGVSVESGQQQKPVWNVASLKLKDEAEGTPDYGALSSALGI